MTDSDDNQKLQYIKSDLLPVNFTQRWKANGVGGDDDDSHNLFMSEPSISEAEEFSDHRLLSPLGSFTEDEDRRDGLPPPPPPPARLLVTPLAPASPGNTSLSSWESPHWNQQQRIHLHFSPGGDSFSHQADASVQSNPYNPYYRTSPYLSSSNPTLNVPSDPYLASGLIPPSTDAKTPERSYVPSSTSTSPASEGQRQVLEAFLDDLRVNSQGQVQQTTGTNISFGSSTYQGLLNATDAVPEKTRSSLQPRKDQSHDTRTSNLQAAGNESSSREPVGSSKNARTDESVVMCFSDDSGDETKQTTEEARPLDWEEKVSADDEKTTEKRASRNLRSARSHGSSGGRNGQTTSGRGHFRQRSGDAAAATLSTGSKEWKGMEHDKIPLPPVPGGHDDDEDDDDDEHKLIKPTNSNNRGKDQKDARMLNGSNRKKPRPIDPTNKSEITQNKDSVLPSGPLYSQYILGSSDSARFTLGRVEKESVTSHKRPSWVRQRREMYRGRKSAGPMLESEDSSQASGDQLPNGVQRVRHASLPASAFTGYMPSPDLSFHEGNHLRKGSHPVQWSPQSINSNSEQGNPNFDFSDWQHFTGSFQEYPTRPWNPPVRSNSLEFGPGFQLPRMGDTIAWGHNSTGSIQSAFSWISDRNREVIGTKSLTSRSELSPLIEGDMNAYVGNIPKEMNPTTDSISPSNDLEPQQNSKRRSTLLLSPLMEGGRTAFQGSPFSNIGKRFAKADRQRFLPTAGFDNFDEKYPTFVCPVCKTRQREFFTVSSAPRQFESASGYIALYFGVYVIAALYIFGLEEGWGKLDCIYFAVITLTTAGLGDFVPTSDGAKVVCSIFIYFGVACIGLLLGSYIAGMLDESSRRAAHANRIKSCPNCVRIQNIQEAAERRRNQYRERNHNQDGYDLTPIVADHCDPVGHTAKRLKRQHRVNLEDQVRVFSSERPSREAHHQGVSSGSKGLSVDFGSDTRSWSFAGQISESQLNDVAPSTHHSPRKHAQQSQSTLNMFRRMHSRHASLDLGPSNAGTGIGDQITPPRKYSADRAMAATIGEQSASQTPVVENTPLRSQWDDDHSDSDTSEDDSDEFSSTSTGTQTVSSSGESSLNLEDQYNGVKNARYVFLTLREALVNSLVIIGTGCFGFYFIEGFSFIDSWYFTTVLLTTVGYGDLVPYTKGGKLFATIYILVAGTILLNNMSMISMIPLELRRRRIERAVLTQFGDSLDDSALRELATGPLIRKLNLATDHAGGLDECTREMFCLAMLVRLGKVTEEDIKLTFAAFKKLDVHDEKVLNSRAIIAGMIQKRRANLELNKANCSQTMSNRSNISMPSYGTLPFTSFGRNSSDPGLAQSNTDCDVHEETVGEQHGYQPL